LVAAKVGLPVNVADGLIVTVAAVVTSVVTPFSTASTIGLIVACALIGSIFTLNSSFSQEVKVVAKATTANANTAPSQLIN